MRVEETVVVCLLKCMSFVRKMHWTFAMHCQIIDLSLNPKLITINSLLKGSQEKKYIIKSIYCSSFCLNQKGYQNIFSSISCWTFIFGVFCQLKSGLTFAETNSKTPTKLR